MMFATGRFALVAYLLISQACEAAGLDWTCVGLSDLKQTVTITGARDTLKPCRYSYGKDEDAYISFCSEISEKFSTDDSQIVMKLDANCYRNSDGNKKQVSCVGFNGSMMTFSLLINEDNTFSSTAILAQSDVDKTNSISVSRGVCSW